MLHLSYFFLCVFGTDETHKRITLLPEKITDDSRVALTKIFFNEDKGANKFDELSAKEANDILVRASPKEVSLHFSVVTIHI